MSCPARGLGGRLAGKRCPGGRRACGRPARARHRLSAAACGIGVRRLLLTLVPFRFSLGLPGWSTAATACRCASCAKPTGSRRSSGAAHAFARGETEDPLRSATEPRSIRPSSGERALVRAARPGEPADIYLVDARRSPEGTPASSLTGVYNLTRDLRRRRAAASSSSGDRAAWVIAQEAAISHRAATPTSSGEPLPTGTDGRALRGSRTRSPICRTPGSSRGVWRRLASSSSRAAYRVVLGLSDDGAC